MSHGESFLAVLRTRFDSPGFYCLDEPEAALSFSSTLGLISVLHRIVEDGGQVLCATHSPVLAAMPGATVLEVGDWGYRRTPGRSWSSSTTGRPTWTPRAATCGTCSATTEGSAPAQQRQEHRVGAVPVRPQLERARQRTVGIR